MAELEKANDKIVEYATQPYAGLSPEDADFMRQYEGKAGKEVVRKVRLDAIRGLLLLRGLTKYFIDRFPPYPHHGNSLPPFAYRQRKYWKR